MSTVRRRTAMRALSTLLVALLAMMAAPFSQSADAQDDLPTIAEIATGDPNFSTLVGALGRADLVSAVADPRADLTVFAPTNAAFDALGGQAVLDALTTAELTNILLYHVAPGSMTATELRAAGSTVALQGDTLRVDVRNENVFINDSQVVIADIAAANGIVHVIDAVLSPPADEPEPPAAVSIADIAAGNPDFSILVGALARVGLVGAVADLNADLTVFAPTNAAFDAIGGQATLDSLSDAELVDILTYHVASPGQDGATLVGAGSATTLQGDDVTVSVRDGNVFINDSQVLTPDIKADNGVIHVIDAVLFPPVPVPPTIAEIALADPDNFSTLVGALDRAGLVGAVADPSADLTVFAPTNAAFDALGGQAVLDSLSLDELSDILLYHVAPGSQDGATLVRAGATTTLQGDNVLVSVRDGDVFINDSRVIIADIQASNGIVHVIDAVLLPEPEPPAAVTIADIAIGNPDFDTLVAALSATGLVDVVADPNQDLTVFAPTDDAFAALGQDTIDALLADIPALTDILLYHVATPAQDGATLVGAGFTTTLQGADVTVSVRDGNVFINDSRVVMADIKTDNGIIHVIDQVLLPPVPEPPTIAEIALANPDLETLVAALTAADLVGVVADPNQDLTVFAPTDDAFAALGQDTIDALLADIPALTDILLYHVASPAQDGASLIDARFATTLQGEDVSVTVRDGKVFINDSQVVIADIEAANGIVHVIDAVLLPPADEPVVVDGARVNIISAVSGRYLDGDRSWWRTNVDTSSTPRLDDEWILEETGNGTFRLLNAARHLYLDADNRRRNYNVDLARRHARGTEWEITQLDNGNYLLRTVDFDRYLDYDRYNVDTSAKPGADDEWQIVIAAGH